jgi:hypothetical protein
MPLFSLENILLEHFAMLIGEGVHVFKGEKIRMGMQEMKFQ